MSSTIRLRRTECQHDAKAMIEWFVLEPRFLEEVKAARFIKNDLVANERFQGLVGSRVDEPVHLPMQPTFHRTKPRDNAIFEILNMGKHFVFFHAERDDYVRTTAMVLKIQFPAR